MLSLSLVAPAMAAGANIDTRITNGVDWILGQEAEYVPGSRAFVSAVTSDPGRHRIYVDEDSMAASVFTMYHKVYTSKKYDEKLMEALTFMMAAQTTGKDFYQYWNMTTGKWSGKGKLFYWNAYAVEGLAFSAFHMRLSTTVNSQEEFYDQAKNAAATCIEEWHGKSQQSDGRWVFGYPDENDHAEIDANGMILTALLYLSLYELHWGDRAKMTTYYNWAEKTVLWILNRQERNKSSWAYGGFYDDETNNAQHTDSNGRAMFGLTTYLRAINSLTNQTEPMFSNIRLSIHIWANNFLLKMVDGKWGVYCYRTMSGTTEYPKQVYRAGELMRALVEIWIVLGDLKFEGYASKLYGWITGINEKNVDFQKALNLKSNHGGFYVGINSDGTLDNYSNVETTATVTSAFIYGRWITIPEFSRNSLTFLIPLTFLVVLCVARQARVRRFKFSLEK
jgi:hypothetical protein